MGDIIDHAKLEQNVIYCVQTNDRDMMPYLLLWIYEKRKTTGSSGQNCILN
jgi:hypothetical protein